ncbi:MAG: protein kinase [Planctomycetia bacterium]|nr:protein kinase [Planctomycetia bacterium]
MAADPKTITDPQTALPIDAAIARLRDVPRSLLLDLAREDQTDRWRRGHRVLVEEYFRGLPDLLTVTEEALVLICGEVLLRRQLGERPTLEEYRKRFPQYADNLAVQFEIDDALGDPSDPTNLDEAPPTPRQMELPGYEFLEELGRGATGVVYLARQKSLNRQVAVKVLASGMSDAKRLARQRKEAEILGRLHHPHVVQIHEVIIRGGHLHLVMEYVDGPTLRESTGGKPIPNSKAASLVRTLAGTIDAVHQAGVLHRDLKPSNVLLSASGEPKITDFGLAKLQSSSNFVTTEDSVLGTPSYMAPEQATGRVHSIGPWTDVYALGAMLYELLTGRAPFLGATILETLSLVCNQEPVPPRHLQPSVPRDLETICLKCLSKSPERRYATAAALADDLTRFIEGRPILARRTRLWEKTYRWCRRNPAVTSLAALLLLAIAAGFGGVLWQWRHTESALLREQSARQEADAGALEIRERSARLKSATSLLEQGRVHAEVRLWDGAEAAFSRAIQLVPDSPDGWAERAQLYARLGLWELAAADLRRSFEAKEPKSSSRWWWLALTNVRMGDTVGYLRIRGRLRDRFGGTTNVNAVCDMVRTASLCGEPTATPQPWVAMQESMVGGPLHNAWCCYLLGLAYYRAGQYEDAVRACRQSLASDQFWAAKPLNYPVLAMTHHALGQADLARTALDNATAAIEEWMQARCALGPEPWVVDQGATGIWPISCWDWLESQLLYDEARARLGLAPAADDWRAHLLRGRSFAGLRRFDEAEGEYATALQLAPDDVQTRLESHRVQGYLHLRRKQWDRAADRFASAKQLAPADTDLWRFEALAHLTGDNMADFRRLCREMLDRFEQTQDGAGAHDVVYACTLAPDTIQDPKRLLPLSRLGAGRYMGGKRLLGAAHYRAGDYEAAIADFEQTMKINRLLGMDWCFLAMAHQRLGHSADAAECLATARAWIEQADGRESDNPLARDAAWGPWHDASDTRRVLGEAEALVIGKPARRP